MNIIERVKAPTPKFFRILRNIGLAIAAAGAAILAAPIGLPAAIVTLGGYLTVGGAVLSAVSQVTVSDETNTETTQSDGKSS
jgi:ABC-type xylose transport system permease subunit